MQIAEMTVREAINLAYFHIVSDMREEDRLARIAGHKFEAELDDRIQEFEEKIGLRPAHEDLALWMHRHVLLPSKGLSEAEINAMFDEGANAALPAGVDESDRWRFEDEEWDGLKNFQGNPWDLPGMGDLRRVKAEEAREQQAQARRETL